MIAAAIVNENRFSFSLNSCAKDYLGEIKNETFLNEKAKEWGIDAKGELWRLPAGYVGFYAEQDAGLTLRLWQRLKSEITKQSLNDVWDMEMELLPILIDDNFSRLLEVLHTKKIKHYNWIESFPSHKLKALSKTVDKTYEIIFNSNLHNEISYQ